MEQIVRALGYQPSFRYEKFRSEWTDGNGHVVIDETPIGDFGEIEGKPDWIDQIATRLEITDDKFITQSYTELFFAWQRKTGSDAQEMTFAGGLAAALVRRHCALLRPARLNIPTCLSIQKCCTPPMYP